MKYQSRYSSNRNLENGAFQVVHLPAPLKGGHRPYISLKRTALSPLEGGREVKRLNDFLIFYFFLFTFSLILLSCGKKETTETEVPLRPVRYGKIIKSGGEASHTFSGTAQSSKEAKLSFKVNGTINNIPVKVGDRVRQGQVIATLDAIDYSVQYDQSVAQLKSSQTQIKSAEAQLISSKSTFERVEKLYENNSVPLSEFEQAKTGYEAAQSQYNAAVAQVTASQKQVESAKNQVSYARLTAPFSGVVTAVNVEENELVGSGNVVAVLTAESRPEVSVGIPEIFISQIKRGQKIDIHFSIIPNKIFKGTVSEVGFSTGQGATYPVTVQIDNPTADMRPGMAANVTFHFGEKKKGKSFLVAPVKAVGEGVDGHFVFLLKENGNHHLAKKHKIEIGELLETGFEIRDGLQEGDLVATAGLKSLLDDMEVKLMEE